MYSYTVDGFVPLCFAPLIAYFSVIFFESSIRIRKEKLLFFYLRELVYVYHHLLLSILSGLFNWLVNCVPRVYYIMIAWFHHFLPENTINNLDIKNQQVDWLELPDHILFLIANKLLHIKDYINFGSVCHSWHAVYTENKRHPFLPRQPPFLMLATELNNHDNQTRSFYSLTEKRVLNYRVPVPHDSFCAGSCFGWLAIVSRDWEITLLNPFLSVDNVIKLPPATTFGHDGSAAPTYHFDNFLGYVGKVVLSDNPATNHNYIAMAIYGDCRRLAFYKPGDKVWTDIAYEYTAINDVVYYGDLFYFVDHPGAVVACDLNHSHPKVSMVAPPLKPGLPYQRYLLESSGELLHVRRFTWLDCDDDDSDDEEGYMDYINSGFDVFKLNLVEAKYTKMDNLQGLVLFVGDNYSYSLSASDFPECKPNSVYFTDDNFEGYFDLIQHGVGPHDMGIYNLEDGTHEPHYRTDSKSIIPAPIWIEPML